MAGNTGLLQAQRHNLVSEDVLQLMRSKRLAPIEGPVGKPAVLAHERIGPGGGAA